LATAAIGLNLGLHDRATGKRQQRDEMSQSDDDDPRPRQESARAAEEKPDRPADPDRGLSPAAILSAWWNAARTIAEIFLRPPLLLLGAAPAKPDDTAIARAARGFPVVGLGLGVAAGLVLLAARGVGLPMAVAAVLAVGLLAYGGGGLFEKPDEFPSAKHVDFPLDEDARRFYRHGPPLLQRYLPFWTANLIDRMKIMLVPLLTILVPLVKIMPPTYRWQVRRKIYRWYHELHAIDIQRPELAPVAQLTELLQRLDAIEEDVRKVRVPLSYSDELYNLRLHIGMIRNRLQDLRSD